MKNNWQLIFILTLLFLLSSCGIPAHQGINNENQITSNLPIAPIQANGNNEIIILTSSSTPTIGVPTIEYTHTPFQITKKPVVYDDVMLFIKEMSENNNNCKLPCIWGIPQGDHINDRFVTFVNKFESSGVDQSYYYETGITENIYWLYAGVWINEKLLKVDFHQKKENESEFLYLTVHSYDTEYDNFWDTNNKSAIVDYFSYFSLSEVMQNYGEPSQIYVGAYPTEEFGATSGIFDPFGVILYYEDQNFLVNYYFRETEESNNYKACFQEINEFTVISWSSDKDISIYEIIENNKLGNGMGIELFNAYYKPIDVVSTLYDFYMDYTGPNNIDCLVYSKKIWGYR